MTTTDSELPFLVRRIVAVNTDGGRDAALDRAGIERVLVGSGVSTAELERVLDDLVDRGELARTDAGFVLSEPVDP